MPVNVSKNPVVMILANNTLTAKPLKARFPLVRRYIFKMPLNVGRYHWLYRLKFCPISKTCSLLSETKMYHELCLQQMSISIGIPPLVYTFRADPKSQ